jgi:N-acetyl-anhydromuramyl-L-alanine amidase AmpD
MKITVEFDSLEEFQQHFTTTDSEKVSEHIIKQVEEAIGESTDVITSAVDKAYHAGRDDVGGKLHKDIKDIDDVAEDYDEEQYKKVKAEFDELFEKYPRHHVQIKSWIKRVVGDYEIRPGLSTNAYNQLAHNARSLREFLS